MQCECLDKSRQHSCTGDDADVEARGDEPGVEEIGGRVGAALWLRAEEILPHCSSEPGIIASTGRFHTGMLSSDCGCPLRKEHPYHEEPVSAT